MEFPDYEKITLLWPEHWRLFVMRFKRRVAAAFLGPYARHLCEIDFIKKNQGEERDALNVPVWDGTYSLYHQYRRWCAYRRYRFFTGSVWPCILSGVVSLIVSLIVCYFQIKMTAA